MLWIAAMTGGCALFLLLSLDRAINDADLTGWRMENIIPLAMIAAMFLVCIGGFMWSANECVETICWRPVE
ncbi:hypothetical protein [Nitratireductor basaltis]|uniref:Uncharacterized protein n=1 Tax=Nitratireductor basaltis TaxID=472175 RepID=A0A084UBL7_9HYPH|nr:hypothetical protein [Nitratireductor basaltis]KFB10353.1 hypothetical protein EL18_01384 [Nitratireductor basaltis]